MDALQCWENLPTTLVFVTTKTRNPSQVLALDCFVLYGKLLGANLPAFPAFPAHGLGFVFLPPFALNRVSLDIALT